MKLKKSGTIYRTLARFYSEWDMPDNLCELNYKLILIISILFVGGFISAVFALAIPMTLITAIHGYLITGTLFFPIEGFINALWIISFLEFFFIFVFLLSKAAEYLIIDRLKKSKKEPGFIKTNYLAWKEKYCPMIEYVDDESKSS